MIDASMPTKRIHASSPADNPKRFRINIGINMKPKPTTKTIYKPKTNRLSRALFILHHYVGLRDGRASNV